MKKNGFTLIELILYIALVSAFLTGAVLFMWDIVYGREKAFQQQIVDQSARIAIEKIINKLRISDSVVQVSVSQIEYFSSSESGTIALNDGIIELTVDGQGTYALTGNQTRVTQLEFLLDENPDTENITINLAIEQRETQVSGQFKAETSISDSVELKKIFNDARAFLIKTDETILSDQDSVSNLKFKNISPNNITIDKMIVEWSSSQIVGNVVGVQIAGGEIEWSGLSVSGGEIDIVDYVVSAGTDWINIDYIDFDSDIGNTRLDILFIFSDGSFSKVCVSLGVTPTLTATPTPEPIASCNAICESNSFASGICLNNVVICTNSGWTYQPDGDIYCTAGANFDTCCCLN